MRAQLYQWMKTNRVMFINAGSLVGTTLITGALGFAYWWIAAQQFQPDAVGLSSAAISTMILLGTICVLGLGTLLIGELPRQPGKEASLISTALIIVAIAGGITGILFALIAPLVSADFLPFRANIGSVLLFASGVSLTSITIVLDQALIGLLRGGLQFWRNAFFAALKLAMLFAVGFWLHIYRGGETIYATWTIANAASLLPLAAFVLIKQTASLRYAMPNWNLLRKLGLPALQHHMLNLIQQVPTTALPVLVTIVLSAQINAWFYMAWMISGFVFTASYALTTVLYAINAAQAEELARKVRLTLNLALVTSIGANIVIQIGANQILGLFGHDYAEQAAGSLRIISLAAFPMIIKFHYIAVSRIDQKLLRALLPVALGSFLELGIATLGAHFGNLLGLCIGWATAVCLEAVFMAPAVFKAVHFHSSLADKQETAELSASSVVMASVEAQPTVPLFSPSEQEKLLRSLSIATSIVNSPAEMPLFLMEETDKIPSISFYTTRKIQRIRPLAVNVSESKTQQLPSVSSSAVAMLETQQLPSASPSIPTASHTQQDTISDTDTQLLPSTPVAIFERETQTRSSVSNSVADKHTTQQSLPDTPIPSPPSSGKLTHLQQLPRIPAAVAAAWEETQRIKTFPVSQIYCVKCHALCVNHTDSCNNCNATLDPKTSNDNVLILAEAEATRENTTPQIPCPQCGIMMPLHAKFCGICGYHITECDEAQSLVPEEPPVIAEAQSLVPEEPPIVAEAYLAVAEAQSLVPEEPPVVAEAYLAVAEAQSVIAEAQSFVPEEPPVVAKKRSIVSIISVTATVLLPLAAFIVWFLSLSTVQAHLDTMTNLGMVSIFPPSFIIALVVLTISFCLTLWQKKAHIPIILLHLFLLIFMLYAITALVEAVPRFAIVYRHEGYTNFIIRHSNVDPNLDAYFNWPGFFIFSAFLTKAAGYQTILSFAAWSPLVLNLLYLGPMYVILTTATTDKRIVWLALWFFYLTNWIGQDYYSPQGLSFFLYLVIIAILVKWFKVPAKAQLPASNAGTERRGRISRLVRYIRAWFTTPDPLVTPSKPLQRAALLITLLAIFGLIVFSHPLTPFIVIASVTALALFRRCRPAWLPLLMIAITAAWFVFMAQAYFVGHISSLLSEFSSVNTIVSQNLTSRVVQGDPEHDFISYMRVIMTVFIWGLALVGGIRRLQKGHRDITYVLLALAPFPVILAQSYGGELLMRIYLFTLPAMAFFAAAIFYTPSSSKGSWWMKGATIITCAVLLGGFLFTRYGNERMDYISSNELAGVSQIYKIAPANSLLLEPWDGAPWEAQGYELYSRISLGEEFPNAVMDADAPAIIQFTEQQNIPKAYMLFTRSENATADGSGLRPGTLHRLENALLKSGRFVLVYTNSDAQILAFIPNKG